MKQACEKWLSEIDKIYNNLKFVGIKVPNRLTNDSLGFVYFIIANRFFLVFSVIIKDQQILSSEKFVYAQG